MNTHIAGPYCPVTSYLRGKLTSEWIPAEETDITVTFAREIAKLRSVQPYYESAYDEVDRDHHMMFADGFKR